MEGDDEPSRTMIDEEIHNNGIEEEKRSRPIVSDEQLDIEAYASLYTGRTKIIRLLFIADHCDNQMMQLEYLGSFFGASKQGIVYVWDLRGGKSSTAFQKHKEVTSVVGVLVS